MRKSFARFIVALLVLASTFQWSRAAYADYVVTGTVSQIKVMDRDPNGAGVGRIYFNFTDPNQTATCTEMNTPKYAWFPNGAQFWKEWYAILLLSKKGASITCSLINNNICQVYSCTLN